MVLRVGPSPSQCAHSRGAKCDDIRITARSVAADIMARLTGRGGRQLTLRGFASSVLHAHEVDGGRPLVDWEEGGRDEACDKHAYQVHQHLRRVINSYIINDEII